MHPKFVVGRYREVIVVESWSLLKVPLRIGSLVCSLIFCMTLGDNKCKKVTQPEFSVKIRFGRNFQVCAENGPKIGF